MPVCPLKINSDLSNPTDAPCGGVCVRAIPHTLQPAAETGPAPSQSDHQLDHARWVGLTRDLLAFFPFSFLRISPGDYNHTHVSSM